MFKPNFTLSSFKEGNWGAIFSCAFAVFIVLHSPDGKPVWIKPQAVKAFFPSPKEASTPETHTQITLDDAGSLFVRETPEKVLKEITSKTGGESNCTEGDND